MHSYLIYIKVRTLVVSAHVQTFKDTAGTQPAREQPDTGAGDGGDGQQRQAATAACQTVVAAVDSNGGVSC